MRDLIITICFVVILVGGMGCDNQANSEDVALSLERAKLCAKQGDISGLDEILKEGGLYSIEDKKVAMEVRKITFTCFVNNIENHLGRRGPESVMEAYCCWKYYLSIIEKGGFVEEYQDFAKLSLVVAEASSNYGLQRQTINAISCYRLYIEKAKLEPDETKIENILQNAGERDTQYLIYNLV